MKLYLAIVATDYTTYAIADTEANELEAVSN